VTGSGRRLTGSGWPRQVRAYALAGAGAASRRLAARPGAAAGRQVHQRVMGGYPGDFGLGLADADALVFGAGDALVFGVPPEPPWAACCAWSSAVFTFAMSWA
jgi:hypothetical protein